MTVNGFNISDNINYLVEEVTFRTIPTRDVKTTGIARKPRMKLTATEWQSKEIAIKGRVFGSSPSDLRTKLDTLQQNFAVNSLAINIDTDRTYTATLETMDIPTQFYNSSMVHYDAKFLTVDPFSYGNLLTASGTTVSGTTTYSGSVTISGTVFAEPTLTIIPTGANAGNSGIKGIQVTYVPTGETITVSGTFNYTVPIVIDYRNFLVTISGVSSDYAGIFSRFDPGTDKYLITLSSGVINAYNYVWGYQPRYYQ